MTIYKQIDGYNYIILMMMNIIITSLYIIYLMPFVKMCLHFEMGIYIYEHIYKHF